LKRDDETTNEGQRLEGIAPELLGIPINLKLKVPRRFQESLKKFIKEHGLDPKFDVRKILEYGLLQESDEELEKLDMERLDLSSEVNSKYAVTKFKAYENFKENQTLAQGLPILVSENESLRRLLLKRGLVDSAESEWTSEKMDEIQKKYLFGGRTIGKDNVCAR
jgi:hypothetical protein